MPKSALSLALLKKKQAEKLSNLNLAKAIGVSIASVEGVLKGGKPYKANAAKFAEYLGLTVDEVVKSKAKAGKKASKKAKTVKAAKKAKPVKVSKSKKSNKGSVALGSTLADLIALADDPLAVKVHKASAEVRKLLDRVLG